MEQIAENPYLQYFIGLPSFREEAPFDASTLVLFRKRISAQMLMEVNEYLLAHKDDDTDTANVPEKSILHLPRAESTRQRKSAAQSADSLAT